jgi:DNA primase
MTILYDGDAAGIKASFRGIDLILEEGLNVKVVLFPEGEDPDSFAKKSSTTELESYISEHQQDFISFKADILLDSEGNDPIKKAQLIKDITHSVSLIPDQITRNVFIPEVAKRFDIKEDVIWAEVNKDRKAAAEKLQKESLRKKSNLQEQKPTSSQNDPYAFEPNPIDDSAIATSAKEKTDDHNEFDLMRILLKYGSNAIKIDHINEKDEKEEVETSIAELICHELHVDELVFEIPLYQRIYKIIAESLENNTFLKISYFQRLEDQEIVRFATEIEMNDHELSANWITKYNIHTSSEKDKLKHAVMSSIFGFKVSKVEKRINELREILSQKAQELSDDELMEILSEQVALEKVKKVISEKMGRIIIN